MALVAYDLKELDRNRDYACLWCLLVASKMFKLDTQDIDMVQTLNIYTTQKSRDNALKYWQRQHKSDETVFFTFEIPVDFYLETAVKHI